VLVEVLEETGYLCSQVDDFVLQSEESLANRFQRVCLNQWPLLNKLGIGSFLQEDSNRFSFLDHFIEESNFQSVKDLLVIVLIISGTKYSAIGDTVDEMFQCCFRLG
jgi:hypothetical protein